MPTPPTPAPPADVTGDPCKNEVAVCKASQFGTVAGCPCVQGRCTVGANGATLGWFVVCFCLFIDCLFVYCCFLFIVVVVELVLLFLSWFFFFA